MANARSSTFKPTLAALAALLIAGIAQADDRTLLRTGSANPYVFVLFDTSGSMNRTPKCTAADIAAGECDFLCDTGSCYAPRASDDPVSKFHQAKSAMFEVLDTFGDQFQLGFATYNQDELNVRAKHWLYHFAEVEDNIADPVGIRSADVGDVAVNSGITLQSGQVYPVPGDEEVFGLGWTCDSSGGNTEDLAEAGCARFDPARLNNAVEVRRTHRFPKLDLDGTGSTSVYIQDSGNEEYRVVYSPYQPPLGGPNPYVYGDEKFASHIAVFRCLNNNCDPSNPGDVDFIAEKNVFFDRVGDFLSWENGPDPTNPRQAFFNLSQAADANAIDTCDGWDGNFDTDVTDGDRWPNSSSSYNLRFPSDMSELGFGSILKTTPGPPTFTFNDPDSDFDHFVEGDVIPLDWRDTHRTEVLARFAPNWQSATADFAVASYFNDDRLPGDSVLELKDGLERPLIARGSTPLGGSIRDFRTWYQGRAQGSAANFLGWENIAVLMDPDWGCRQRYLLVITDGDNTCSGPAACSGTASLRAQADLKTYVVAFGVPNTPGNSLVCMAANGGTGDPIFPQNKQQLVDALTAIFLEIQADSRSFTAASVPTVNAFTADSVYFSSFVPLRDEDHGLWAGRIDSFRSPVPLNDANEPDLRQQQKCSTSLPSGCRSFITGATTTLDPGGGGVQIPESEVRMLDQAPDAAQLASNNFRLGLGDDERRVFYAMENQLGEVPGPLKLFKVNPGNSPAGPDFDLMTGFNLPFIVGNPTSEDNTKARMRSIVSKVLEKKEAEIEDENGNIIDKIIFVLGDIFHSNPVLIAGPQQLPFFFRDLCVEGPEDDFPGLCPDLPDPDDQIERSYRSHVDRTTWRRRLLTVGANDGQLHFFDAGTRQEVNTPVGGLDAVFKDGSGKESFSYIPRVVLPILRDQVERKRHIYSMDGNFTVTDVMIDPVHTGNPVRDQREWRTVLIGGFREGGSVITGGTVSDFRPGYYALDVTQPDPLIRNPDPLRNDLIPTTTGLVPGCLRLSGDQLAPNPDCQTLAGEQTLFPGALWEFTDYLDNPDAAFDEEDTDFNGIPGPGNGRADLGETWSQPTIGAILICDGSDCEADDLTTPALDPGADLSARFVAIFGGGIDPSSVENAQQGNFLYMVDVETGELLYKRELDGAVPAPPAVVDANEDGLLDTIYVGTARGILYKVDLTALSGNDVPRLQTVNIDNNRLLGSPLPPGGTVPVRRITDAAWEPFPIFNANFNKDGSFGGIRSIFHAPTALFIPELGQFALAFGTGNRENLWERSGVEGRFYLFVDDAFAPTTPGLPLDETDLKLVEVGDPPLNPETESPVLDPGAGDSRGFTLRLDPNDRIITQAFGLVGVVIFTAFQPDPIGAGQNVTCSRAGTSRVFTVFADTGNPVGAERVEDLEGFSTAPHVTRTATHNPDSGGGERLDQEEIDELNAIAEALKRFFPKGCKFNPAFSQMINITMANTAVNRVAPIPTAMCPADFVRQ